MIQAITLPTSVQNIGEHAFYDQYNSSTYKSTLQTINIPFTKSNFESNVTLGNDWYDKDYRDLQLIYIDYTCNRYNASCVAN